MLMSTFGFGCNVSHYQAEGGLKTAIKALKAIRSRGNMNFGRCIIPMMYDL